MDENVNLRTINTLCMIIRLSELVVSTGNQNIFIFIYNSTNNTYVHNHCHNIKYCTTCGSEYTSSHL